MQTPKKIWQEMSHKEQDKVMAIGGILLLVGLVAFAMSPFCSEVRQNNLKQQELERQKRLQPVEFSLDESASYHDNGVLHDNKYHVTCWRQYAGEGSFSMVCIPDQFLPKDGGS